MNMQTIQSTIHDISRKRALHLMIHTGDLEAIIREEYSIGELISDYELYISDAPIIKKLLNEYIED